MKTRRFSRKRESILAKIRSTACHPTADWVYHELRDVHPDLSLATVYRNLALFKEEGSIVSVGNVNGQERFDGNTKPHDHFFCNLCFSVFDVDLSLDKLKIIAHLEEIAHHRVEQVDFMVNGTCSTCLKAD